MEDAGSQCGIGTSVDEHIGNVVDATCTARGDDGDAQMFGQSGKGVAGVSLACAVVVHRGEEQFARAALLCLVCPGKEFLVGVALAAMGGGEPLSVGEAGIDGDDHKLRTILRGYLVDQLGAAYGSAVDADLVGTGIEQAAGVVDGADASTHSEGDVYLCCDAAHEVGEGVAALLCGTDVEVYQFVGSLTSILAAQGDGVAHIAQTLEVDALDRTAILDVEAGYNAFG